MGITLNELLFDPANPDDGANVGAWVRAGDDGTAIGHVGDALKVDIGSVSDLDIRNLVFADDKVDASGSEIKQDSFDSLKHSAQSVTATASALAGTPLANRVKMLIQNLGNKEIFIGSDNTVTTSNGVKIPAGGSGEFMFSAASTPHAISSGTADVRILEMAY